MRSRWITNALLVLLPSFVVDQLRHDHHHLKPLRLHATSYIDGLRGIASLIVSICHYTEDNHAYFVPSWGLNKRSSAALQLPFVRVIYSGRPMIHVFFVISGFVLSYKPLKALHARDVERCHAALASSAFRRPIRLFGPCLVSTFMIVLLTYSGFLYEPLPSLSEQLEDWWHALFRSITWPWSWDYDLRPTYDIHLWTVPIEFVHSMLLFMVLLVVSPMRRPIRLAALVSIIFYCLSCGRWAAFEFIGGSLIAELHLTQANKMLTLTNLAERRPRQNYNSNSNNDDDDDDDDDKNNNNLNVRFVLKTATYTAAVLLWWFIAGWPNENAERTPGIQFLLAKTPQPFSSIEQDECGPQKFWFSLSAMGLVWAITQVDLLQRCLENSVVQYLGRISYSLYIVHGPILNMAQGRVIGRVAAMASGNSGSKHFRSGASSGGLKGLLGADTPTQQTLVWILGIVIMWPCIIWAADVFWRLVDRPIMAGARKLEDWCSDA
ncbi:hypothetical protein SODALDRAFT_12442 [Sodiomyces alkalinus F11]|uniref:Acyltransferase 3 domain-containing protein n=1 Tax=Sodiomyces alkalinus (strain CBS 110278 / VKM F-3762 / F11) TaxID=1314773 RepID=A0A3N2Q6A2_SODAK|nr:hypothetical protein SODALDRAFT_12442 [Sodiomyces alkalinus F11]ROT42313.1 hypothetical protein SODALDRAFT_12442 [Sodiomyces alkalinus F11]